MQTRDKEILAQFFVCTNERAVGEHCAGLGSIDVFQNLKNRSKTHAEWKGKVSVTKSGCLGFCSEGIAAVLYPQRKWLTEIKAGEEEKIVAWINEELGLPNDHRIG